MSGETLVKARGDTDVPNICYTWSFVAKDKPNHQTAGSLRSFPQDNWSSTASSSKANDWRTWQRAVLDLFSNLKWLASMGFFVEPLGHVVAWANFGKRNWR